MYSHCGRILKEWVMSTNEQPQRFKIPIGPQHPALKEPAHFEFSVDGEIVTGASVRLGYAHRGIEKATESRNWVQNLYLLERICGICSHIHAMAYSIGVEKLAGVTVPLRANAIRTLVAELERIHSHMLWLGVAAHEAGFDTLFMYAWRDREIVMDLLEQLSGNRVNYSVNVLGGVKFDLDEKMIPTIFSGLDRLEQRTAHYLDIVSSDHLFLQRTRGIGVMTHEQAAQLGVMGPTARASGVLRDVRIDAPYASYTDHPITPVLDERGDLEARFIVRIKELFETYRLIRQLLDQLPSGEIKTRMPRRIKAGETISRVEAPRGELFYFIKSNGTDTPQRIKIRTPTLCNMASISALAPGLQLADMPMLLVGVDPCFSCNDRMIAIRSDVDEIRWDWASLRKYAFEFYQQREDT
jgi:NADH-quinone oxidoreductase subunit D